MEKKKDIKRKSKWLIIKQKKNQLENLKIKLYLLKTKNKKKRIKNILQELYQDIIRAVYFKTSLIEKKEQFSLELNKKFKSEDSQKKMIMLLNKRISYLLHKLGGIFKSENINLINLDEIFKNKKDLEISKKMNSLDELLF